MMVNVMNFCNANETTPKSGHFTASSNCKFSHRHVVRARVLVC